MATTQIIQLVSTGLFVVSACLYYNIRRTLHKRGYPVSIFVYSGPCWGHYKDLIEKSEPAEQRRLKLRKAAMTASMVLALVLVLLSGFIPGSG